MSDKSKFVQTYDGIYIQDEDGQGWTLVQDSTGFPYTHYTNEEFEEKTKAKEPRMRKTLKKVKLKKAKPRGRLYRLDVHANITDPPRDTSVPLEGPVIIYTPDGVHFGNLYPVKEEAER